MPEQTEEMLTGDVTLDIGGEHFEMHLSIPAAPVNPRKMLPVLRQMTNSIVARAVERTETAGTPISCKAGCGACCRQPLLISEAEVFELAELVASFPEPRRTIVTKRFEEGLRHFEELGWFTRFDNLSEVAKTGPSEEISKRFVSVLSEYIAERIACPFLEDESCSIYESRPLVCREYLVTSPAENCSAPTPSNTAKLKIAGSASRAFAKLCKTPNSSEPSSLLLIRLLEFAAKNKEGFDKKAGPAWAEDFFRALTGKQEPGTVEQSV